LRAIIKPITNINIQQEMNITLPHTIENITGEKLTFLRIVIKDGVDYLETESEVQPNAGPPMHVHFLQYRPLVLMAAIGPTLSKLEQGLCNQP
jgi:hypothetical protein